MTTRRHILRAFAAVGLGISLPALPARLRAQQTTIVKQGTFEGASGHKTAGSAAIIIENGRNFVRLGNDFSLDGAPDPKVAVGGGGARPDTILAPLAAGAGGQTYPLPEGTDPAAVGTVWIWCEEYDVPLGEARLH